MKITIDQLQEIATKNVSNVYVTLLNTLAPEYGITTPLRMCHFLAQCLHESCNFKALQENFNYSAQGLLKVFPKYFNASSAAAYARKPQKIASRVYANRYGNGAESTGDGWKYRGRGCIQVTFKDNYKEYQSYLNSIGAKVDLMDNPDLLMQPQEALRSAMWFWQKRGLNKLADADNLTAITKKVNGGTNGLAERRAILLKAKKVLL